MKKIERLWRGNTQIPYKRSIIISTVTEAALKDERRRNTEHKQKKNTEKEEAKTTSVRKRDVRQLTQKNINVTEKKIALIKIELCFFL